MSNLIVKMMSDEHHLDDTNKSKGFKLVESFGEVKCSRTENGEALILIPNSDGIDVVYHPQGTTYLLHNGKTVSIFSHVILSNVKVNRIASAPAKISLDLLLGKHQEECLLALEARKSFILSALIRAGEEDLREGNQFILFKDTAPIQLYITDEGLTDRDNYYTPVGKLITNRILALKVLEQLDGYTIIHLNEEREEFVLACNRGKGFIDILKKK